jgi:hypothetical protein
MALTVKKTRRPCVAFAARNGGGQGLWQSLPVDRLAPIVTFADRALAQSASVTRRSVSLASPCSAMSFATVKRPLRPQAQWVTSFQLAREIAGRLNGSPKCASM